MPELTTLDQLLLVLVAGLAIPLGAKLKDRLHNWVRPEFVTIALAAVLAFGLCWLLSCDLTPAELIEKTLQAVGAGTFTYGATRAFAKNGKKPF